VVGFAAILVAAAGLVVWRTADLEHQVGPLLSLT
jgi:hypothetical protein